MSVFALKLLAVLSMLTDHSAWFLFLRGYIGGEAYMLMRGFGRLAFPIFCFLIVNGFEHSRDRVAYLSRLCLFAALSQIPYGALFSQENFFICDESRALYLVDGSPLPALALIAVCAVWYFCVRRDITALSPLPALVLGLLRLRLGGVSLLTDHLDVFYTLSLGLAFMCLARRVVKREAKWYSSLLCALALALAVWLLGKYVDYSYKGLALLALLYLVRRSRAAQVAVICLWSAATYLPSVGYALCGAAPALLLLLYRGEQGPRFKWGFYIIYPAHLAVLAALNLMLQ